MFKKNNKEEKYTPDPLRKYELEYITKLMLSEEIKGSTLKLLKYWKVINDEGDVLTNSNNTPLGNAGRRFKDLIPYNEASNWIEQWEKWIPFQPEWENFKIK